ncbi:MAG: DUF4065 domain-containing protein [Sulfobacillus sp.]|nr:DUF4065 domain-containing protein [Sulfobacillus sp.]
MYAAETVAEYFLSLVDPEAGDAITNLKLQKLLYYAQGLHLALFGRPLFSDRMEAWMHGPVVPTVYHRYKTFGVNPLPVSEDFDPAQLDAETQAFLNEVYEVYGQFSAWKLRNMTHTESPWLDAPEGQEISHDRLQEFFQTRIEPA